MDWFPAVMTLIGVLVGVGIQEIRIWRERTDKYKDIDRGHLYPFWSVTDEGYSPTRVIPFEPFTEEDFDEKMFCRFDSEEGIRWGW